MCLVTWLSCTITRLLQSPESLPDNHGVFVPYATGIFGSPWFTKDSARIMRRVTVSQEMRWSINFVIYISLSSCKVAKEAPQMFSAKFFRTNLPNKYTKKRGEQKRTNVSIWHKVGSKNLESMSLPPISLGWQLAARREYGMSLQSMYWKCYSKYFNVYIQGKKQSSKHTISPKASGEMAFLVWTTESFLSFLFTATNIQQNIT